MLSLVSRISTLVALALLPLASHAQGVPSDKIRAFMKVTGYDVVIQSLQQSAMAGPGLVGSAPEDFGKQYSALAEEVFALPLLEERAVEILSAVMPEDLIDYGAAFYASELGQRLVEVENASHLSDDDQRMEEGQKLVETMAREQPVRLDLVKRMASAVGSEEVSLTALVEMQVRFILAAAAAGAIPMDIDEQELRATTRMMVDDLRMQIQAMNVIGNAWTYRDLTNDDIQSYVEVLEGEKMQAIYEILNAVQFQIMIERYEILGQRMGELRPESEL